VLKLSVKHSLTDAGHNVGRRGESLLHELACLPASLSQFIVTFNGSYVLRVPNFDYPLSTHQSVMYDDLALLTDNSMGSGHRIHEMNVYSTSIYWQPQSRAEMGEPFFQYTVDGVLSMIRLKKEYQDTPQVHTFQALQLLHSWANFRLRTI
jgi:hypothetical protein